MKKVSMLGKRVLFVCAAVAVLSASAQTPRGSAWFDNVKVSGFIIGQYQYSSQEGSKSNSFDIRMARVALDGRVARDFYWKTQIQITGNTATLGSSPRLVDAFVEWQKYKEMQVRLGEFQVPFSLESPIHPVDVGFMNNSQAILKLVGYSDRSGQHSSNGRDIGLMVQGDVLRNASGRPLLHYGLSVVNGQGINLKDVDQRKNIVGTLWLMPVKGMRVGVSGWEGTYARKGTWRDEADGSEKSGVRSLPQHRYALSADYNGGGWTARTEYIHSSGKAFAKTMQDTNGATSSDCSLSSAGSKADAFYALVIVPVMKNKVNAKARYDLYRSTAEWQSAKGQYEVGVDYFFAKNLRLSAEYALVNDRTLASHNYSIINTELSIKF